MKDIKLLETCEKCGENITLMESISTDTDKLMLVKRCLTCGGYPVTEVAELIHEDAVAVDEADSFCNDCTFQDEEGDCVNADSKYYCDFVEGTVRECKLFQQK